MQGAFLSVQWLNQPNRIYPHPVNFWCAARGASVQFTVEPSDDLKTTYLKQLAFGARASSPAHLFKVVFTSCLGCF